MWYIYCYIYLPTFVFAGANEGARIELQALTQPQLSVRWLCVLCFSTLKRRVFAYPIVSGLAVVGVVVVDFLSYIICDCHESMFVYFLYCHTNKRLSNATIMLHLRMYVCSAYKSA